MNKQQFNKVKNYMVTIMHRANSEFYFYEINSATSKKSLLAIWNKLLGLEQLALFPNIYLMDQMDAIFNDFLLMMSS